MNKQISSKAEKKTLDKINIYDILIYIFKYKLIIILCVTLGLALGLILHYIEANKDIKPSYEAMSSMLVTAKTSIDIESGEPIYSNSSDLNLAKSIIPTVAYLVKTDRVISLLSTQLNDSSININKVKKLITLTNAEDTPIIEVSLIWPDEQQCITIINALMDILPQAMIDTINLGNVTVIDKATGATPIYADPSPYILFTTAIGLAMGLLIAFLLGIISPKVRTQNDVKDLLKLDTIAELPFTRRNKNMLLTNDELSVDYRESCAIMGSIFQYVAVKQEIKTFYITSSVSGEGKTTVSINLALTLAQKMKRVILIDTDIHRPMISELLGISEDAPTLQDVFDDLSLIEKALIKINDYVVLLRTRAGDSVINADSFKELIDIIKEYTDYIIIDTPPVGLVSDALAFNSCVDGALFVIKQDYANMGLVADSINMIKDSGAKVFGCVINGKRQAVSGKYYTKGQYYSEYYKNDKKKKNGYYSRNKYYQQKHDENGTVIGASAGSAGIIDTHMINPEQIADAVTSHESDKKPNIK
jgi:ATPases involved in chromosome partitioning